MTREHLQDWATQTVTLGISHITFTGGEPYLRFPLLQAGTETVAKHECTSAVFTNAWWGKSVARARKWLEGLPGLSRLYLSSDLYHWEFVEPERVMNVVCAARELGISEIVISVCYVREEEKEIVRQRFASLGDNVTFYFGEVIRSNHIDRLVPPIPESVLKKRIGQFDPVCFLHSPLVNPTGTVAMCHVGKEEAHGHYGDSPFVLGTLQEESLLEILLRAEDNPVYTFLRANGPRGLAQCALDIGVTAVEARMRRGFSSGCDMCSKLLPHPRILAAIQNRGFDQPDLT